MKGGRAMNQQSKVVIEKAKANKALGIGTKKTANEPSVRKRRAVENKSPKGRRGSKAGTDGSDIDLDSASDLFASSSESSEESTGFLDTLGEMGGGAGGVSKLNTKLFV